MSDNLFSSGGEEDLPRTVRQQKEAVRARDQLARDMLGGPRQAYTRNPAYADSGLANEDFQTMSQTPPGEDPPATVTRLQLPFFHLAGFFLKAVVAAIPALIVAVAILMAVFWMTGQVVEHYLPWLVKMRIVVSFPG